MILSEATMEQLTAHKAELSLQMDAVNAELAKRNRDWHLEQQRARAEWYTNNSGRNQLRPTRGAALDKPPNEEP